ncbi:MAG: DUF935 family protein [Verrucomicrobiota bacterium]
MDRPHKSRPRKITPSLGAERVKLHLQSRFNPIRGLTPETLSSHLDAFDLGYLTPASLLWQKIRDRDDTVKAVVEKRELSASLLNWEILALDDSPEAEQHKQALEEFYNGLTATHALDRNTRGGVSLLVRQMMHAQGHKWAVHEIVWQPGAPALTAEFRFIPLQFFENRTGALRFLRTELALEGEELDEGGWMVTAGAGLMEATSIAYLFKQLPLKDWLIFCEKAGIPALHGKTDAQPGTKEWDDFRDALANFGVDWALVTSLQAQVAPVDLKTSGQLPHPLLVDRMDRAIARLWRGADLGTVSREGQSVGSNPQESETDILEAADAQLVSETLQHYVDRWVIRHRFGAEPLASFQLHLIRWGVPRSKRELLARYGRPAPEEGEDLACAAASVVAAPETPSTTSAQSERKDKRQSPRQARAAAASTRGARGFAALANEADPSGSAFLGLTNEFASTASTDGWARVPYGEWPHEEGLQRFGRAEAEEMVRYFKNTWNRLKRAITGLPIYRGHPDLADTLKKQRPLANAADRAHLDQRIAEVETRWPDRREYGSIADLEARDDGLYLKPVLTPAGAALVNEDGLRFFSPHWLGKPLSPTNGRPVYGPAFLLSIGLTDRPNIAGTSLVNSAPAAGANRNPNQTPTNMPPWLIELLGLVNEPVEDQEKKAKALLEKILERPDSSTLATEQSARSAAETQLAETKSRLATAETALVNERAAHTATARSHNATLLDAAVREGRILEAARPVWLSRLERDFPAESAALANERPALKTTPKTGALGERKAQFSASSKFTALVNERATRTGESWDSAWHATKRTADGRALFEEMSRPAA